MQYWLGRLLCKLGLHVWYEVRYWPYGDNTRRCVRAGCCKKETFEEEEDYDG